MKMGYYPGCSLHSTGIEYGLSLARVAEALGLELEEVRRWVCCGSSPAHQSDETLSIALPALNLAILREENQLDEVCVPCASCFSRLKFAQARMEDEAVRKRIERILERPWPAGVRVLHALEVVTQRIGRDAVRARVKRPLKGLKVACYYGCLMTRPPKVTGQADPENPLAMESVMETIGAEPADWNLKTACCGASFALTDPAVVLELTRRILEDAAAAGAEVVAVGCPLCHANLDTRQEGINERFGTSFRMPVFYFTELMGLAFGLDAADLGLPRHLTDAEGFLRERGLL